jgi:hypothetical protein
MTNQEVEARSRWAPWWVYVAVLVPANALKQVALGDAPVALNVAVTLVLVAVGVVAITAVHRSR